MKHLNLLKSTLLLFALVAGSGSVWAKDTKTTFTFNNAGERAKIIAIKTGTSSTGGETELLLENISLTSAKGYYDGSASSNFNIYASGTMTVSLNGIAGYIKSIKITYPKCYPFKTPTDWSATSDAASWSTTSKIASGKYIEYSTTSENVTSVNLVNEAGGKTNPQKIEVTYVCTSVSLTPTKAYTTLTSAYDLNFTGIEGLKAYIATSVSAGSVQMTQVNKVPAGTGLVLVKSSGSSFNIPVFDGTGADDVSGNQMVGSATSTTAVAANAGYILSDGVFQPASAGTLPAGKAYLNIAVASAHPLSLDFGDGDVTGINSVQGSELKVNGYFDLQGRRVAQPAKGLYIVNGKKVAIK